MSLPEYDTLVRHVLAQPHSSETAAALLQPLLVGAFEPGIVRGVDAGLREVVLDVLARDWERSTGTRLPSITLPDCPGDASAIDHLGAG
jgi:hypothetical protein